MLKDNVLEDGRARVLEVLHSRNPVAVLLQLLTLHDVDYGLQIVDCIDLCTLAFTLCGQLQLSYNRSTGTSELVLVFISMNTQMS